MKKFTDNKGRDWLIEINITAVKHVRAALQINLLEAQTGQLQAKIAQDIVLLVDILYVLCKAQADERKISDEEFGRAMYGDVFGPAKDAFEEELAAFFQSGQRQLILTALAKTRKLEQIVLERGLARLQSDDLEKKVLAELEKLNDSSGSSPASPASTPAL
jgi:hypothetical protein